MVKRFIAVILCCVVLTGCYDRKELNKIGIVLAVALDKDTSTNEVVLYCEIVKPYVLKSSGATGSGAGGTPTKIVMSKGYTVYDAIRNMSRKLDRKAFFSHNKIIIISEKLAREGVSPVLDAFMRDPEIRPLVWVAVAKGVKVSSILTSNHGIDQIQAAYINDMIKTRWATSEIQMLNILEFYKKLIKEGSNPTTGVMGITKENSSEEIALLGTAVFKKDKLIGYLNYKESRGLNWITNHVDSGIINIQGNSKTNNMIAVQIIGSTSKIVPKIKGNNITFNIQIRENSEVGEVQDSTNIYDLKDISKLEDEEKEVIKGEIERALDKAKYDFHTDIFGFGNSLSRYYPREWKKMKKDWNKLFLNAKYDVNIKVKLKRAGQIQKPFKAKE
ncbi:Ger(x)C family spore germination protein [Clostridium felsineum]|uniref:Ger(x)C family spore germination protein n=1 Tax=Clostridium felsineum TaxID=36839 RepID=UPI00214D287F|nr:Ger(x)C family spore germination protein [Clostridium felsineum]MCR3760576.1 Ger(x)C family spore germination protein [Clostridium felsineum]